MSFEVGRVSILGSREEQQDAMLCVEDGIRLIAAICDGMGGLHNGSCASRTAVRILQQLYEQKNPSVPVPEFLLQSMDILDEAIFKLGNQAGNQERLGSTIVSTIVESGQMYWLSVGDSRMYLFRNGEMVRVTTDHNYYLLLNRALENGELTEEEYQKESVRGEALISYLGIRGIEYLDLNRNPLTTIPGDVIALMSDGLYRCVSEERIRNAIQKGGTAQEIADRLIRTSVANAKGCQDNTTVLIIKII